ncbi:MAG: hypothetical protein ACX931_13890 [Saccharospirillum sp.]
MFQFRRRTLWIIIYLLIPVIFVLHRVSDDAVPAIAVEPPTQWSLDALTVRRQGPLWWVNLPDANHWRLTVAQSEAPATELGLGLSDAVHQGMQYGYWWVSVSNPSDADVLAETLTFLATWLPDAANRQWVVSGAVTDELLQSIRLADAILQGAGRPLPSAPANAAPGARWSSPPVGSDAHLAFLVWVSVVQQRLGERGSQVVWDHRYDISIVRVPDDLTPAMLEPVSEAEFEAQVRHYQAQAEQRDRSAEQIHGSLVVTALAGLPETFMQTQPERLAQLDLDAVNRQRQRSLEND